LLHHSEHAGHDLAQTSAPEDEEVFKKEEVVVATSKDANLKLTGGDDLIIVSVVNAPLRGRAAI
jgi:hypothetical protein